MTLMVKAGIGVVLWAVAVTVASSMRQSELIQPVLVVAAGPALIYMGLLLLLGAFMLLTWLCLLMGRLGWWLERSLDWLEGKRVF